MIIHPVDPLIEKAEGLCLEAPYNTELVSIDGCSIHFWLRRHTPIDAELQTLLTVARRHRGHRARYLERRRPNRLLGARGHRLIGRPPVSCAAARARPARNELAGRDGRK
jgi:hypothetical protein